MSQSTLGQYRYEISDYCNQSYYSVYYELGGQDWIIRLLGSQVTHPWAAS